MVTPSLKHPYKKVFFPGWKNKVLYHPPTATQKLVDIG